MFEIAEPCPAILLFHRDAMQAERTDPGPEVAREQVAPVDLGGPRRDLVCGEITHGVADRVRGFAEIEVEHAMRVGVHDRAAFRKSCDLLGSSLIRSTSA